MYIFFKDFYTVVLDELVLEVAMRYHNDVLAEPRDDNINRSRRHAAYRQYIMWTMADWVQDTGKLYLVAAFGKYGINFPKCRDNMLGFWKV